MWPRRYFREKNFIVFYEQFNAKHTVALYIIYNFSCDSF